MTPHLDDWRTLATAAALAAGMIAARFIPFLLFSRGGKLPGWVLYLGGVLPHASMAMILVYCLKGVNPLAYAHGLPEILAILFTAGAHLWRSNVLLSIAGGTAFYMFLVQKVF